MASRAPQPERIAEIIVTAEIFGSAKAAELHGIAVRTVNLYRQWEGQRPPVAEACQAKRKLAKERMGEEFIRYLRRWSSKLDELVQQAPPERMRDVAGAIKILGDLFTVREVFGGQQPEPDREGPEAPEAEGSAGDSAAEQVH